ncbi:uncharacterized protein Dsimw501_GD28421, partial [Drosophila simulans]
CRFCFQCFRLLLFWLLLLLLYCYLSLLDLQSKRKALQNQWV